MAVMNLGMAQPVNQVVRTQSERDAAQRQRMDAMQSQLERLQVSAPANAALRAQAADMLSGVNEAAMRARMGSDSGLAQQFADLTNAVQSQPSDPVPTQYMRDVWGVTSYHAPTANDTALAGFTNQQAGLTQQMLEGGQTDFGSQIANDKAKAYSDFLAQHKTGWNPGAYDFADTRQPGQVVNAMNRVGNDYQAQNEAAANSTANQTNAYASMMGSGQLGGLIAQPGQGMSPSPTLESYQKTGQASPFGQPYAMAQPSNPWVSTTANFGMGSQPSAWGGPFGRSNPWSVG